MSGSRSLDTTRGSLGRAALSLAWPAVLQALLVNCYAFNDFFFVGRIGDSAATAALSACFALLIVSNTLLNIIPAGAMTLMAQHFGAGHHDRVASIFRQGLVASLLWAMIVAAAGIACMDLLVAAANVTEAVGERIATYLTVVYGSSVLFACMRLVTGLYYACGNTTLPLKLEILSLALNTALNAVLVLGLGPVPQLGILGAAIATATSRGIPGVVGLILGLRAYLGFPIHDARPGSWRPQGSTVRKMARIGLFESLGGLLYAIIYLMLNRIAGELGPAAQGGLGAGLRGIEWIAFAFGDGFMMAAIAIVGQNVGAKKPDRARRGAWLGGALSAGSTQFIGLSFLLLPEQLCALVTQDPETLTHAVTYVRVIGWVMWAIGFEMAMYGAMIGAGRTQVILAISATGNILRIPIALVLIFGADALLPGLAWLLGMADQAPAVRGEFIGLAYAIAATAVFKALCFVLYLGLRHEVVFRPQIEARAEPS